MPKLINSKKAPRSKFASWLTSDKHEIELRRKRAHEENMIVSCKENSKSKLFTDFLVRRKGTAGESEYKVEIRSYDKLINHCDCPDFKKNFLGTCKHIEKIVAQRKQVTSVNSPYIEIFLDYSDSLKLKVLFPPKIDRNAKLFMDKYLNSQKQFREPVSDTLQVFIRDIQEANPSIFDFIRISDAVFNLNKKNIADANIKRLEKTYKDTIKQQALNGTFLKYPLYDYQVEGMLHLAFRGRAMLADEMGLGKTVQAVAAATLLKEYMHIGRALIVCPTSLKTEWEEQIRKFTDLQPHVLYGNREERLRVYGETQSFFILTNYEQVLRDYDDINNILQPDLVILDEAQRIKNWKTKTAANIKKLNSKYAFILTGTPVENRIDELYSLTEFVNPEIFGSLFRFNRKFYNFDEEGKTYGLKNLKELHETIKPVMIRRRKDEIAEQLPERIDNNYFVEMTAEQLKRYEEYSYQVSILMSMAKNRPLTPREHDELQRKLACMRMLCDTVYILDQSITESPKLDEVIKILNDIWENAPERKVIIFSEWVKMLELVKNQLEQNNILFSWHVGSVNQQKRRDEINNFKNNPECKVFLSSDSGGVGLNLQAASVVINMDLPWNPAKLEQRIARAWRKHQKNSVNVINLISEKTIEHKMLATLEYKKGLAEGVLDGRGDFSEIEKPDSKNKFMERLASIMNTSFVKEAEVLAEGGKEIEEPAEQFVPKEEIFRQEVVLDKELNLKLCQGIIDDKTGEIEGIVAVSNSPDSHDKIKEIAKKSKIENTDSVLVINDETFDLLQKLSKLGVISFNASKLTQIYKKPDSNVYEENMIRKNKKALAQSIFAKAQRSIKMAQVLQGGGFEEESIKPIVDAVKFSGKALLVISNDLPLDAEPGALSLSDIDNISEHFKLKKEVSMLLIFCFSSHEENLLLYPGISDYAQMIFDETYRYIASYN